MGRSLDGKTALITGAARGIGLAIVKKIAAEGANIVALDIAALEKVDSISSSQNVASLLVHGDVADVETWERVTQLSCEKFGSLDIVVNNAGISGPSSLLIDYPEDAFDQTLRVNCRGVFLGMKFGARIMNNGGAIVNVSSVSGLGGGQRLFAYNASKHAVIGMTKVGAIELASKSIRVNAVCPAMTDTEMMQSVEVGKSDEEIAVLRGRFTDMIPLARYAKPSEIADAIAYLASDRASFINGVALPVDGGLKAQ